MNKAIFIIPLLLIFIGCTSPIPNDWKTLDVGPFKITVPPNWSFEDPGQQEDSFVGQITGRNVLLSFDCSDRGYANSLLHTEREYLNKCEWMRECYFCKSGITYSGRIPDYNAKKTIHLPTKQQKIRFPKADYIADLTLKDSTINVPIEIPAAIKNHNIQVDSDSRHIYKTIWSKFQGKGMTGVYIHSRTNDFNFQMNAKNLSLENQEQALAAFKTIQFK